MVLELTRVDYALLGLSSPRCMKLIPDLSVKAPQKVVFGGNDGVVQVFSFKKGEMQLSFKTLPGDSISALELGGTIGGVQDKIFVSSKNEVRGYTKKGKFFLALDTNSTESIKSMHLLGNDLLIAGTHVYNHYKDCKDVHSYLSSDVINDVIALNIERTQRLTTVLACQDRVLRVLDRSALSQTLPLPSAPVTISLYNDNGGDSGDHVVYAMENGQIGMVQIARNGNHWKWLLDNPKQRGAVTCMCWFDLTKDGMPELIVGRDDGSIQVYGEPLERLSDTDPLIERYNYVCNESITSIQAGNVGNMSFDEIIATTYTGWLFGLTTEVMDKQVSLNANNSGVSIKLSTEDKLKIERLRADIDELEKSVMKERERYQLSTQDDSMGISSIPHLTITDKLTIETETAIDNVLLQSDVPVKLLDVEQNSAVVSHSVCRPNSGNRLLATYRCQVNTTKLSISLQFGNETGNLKVYITPQSLPKATHVRNYKIRQLGLYSRTHDFDNLRSCNILNLKGNFSLAEMHNWVSNCLPEISEKIPTTDSITYNYISSFVSTVLQCTYSKGEAEFKSDDISTISSLKDFLTKEATMKKINLEISFVVNDESINAVLTLLYPKLDNCRENRKQGRLLEALKDIEISDHESVSNLMPECLKVMQKENQIQSSLSQQWNNLERIENAIVNLFIDWFRFKNANGRGKLAALNEMLQACTLEELIDYFDTSQTDVNHL